MIDVAHNPAAGQKIVEQRDTFLQVEQRDISLLATNPIIRPSGFPHEHLRRQTHSLLLLFRQSTSALRRDLELATEEHAKVRAHA